MTSFEFTPIAFVRSPLRNGESVPIQPHYSDIEGEIELKSELTAGLKDLDGFSHITVIYVFDRSDGFDLLTKPYLDDVFRGVFATRSPRRPNPIGISVLRLIGIEGNVLHVKGLDILDGTPVLDIKPFVPSFVESDGELRAGWLADKH